MVLALWLQWGVAADPAGETVSGAAGYNNAKGELKASVAVPLDRVWIAALHMVREMEYGTAQRRKDAQRAEIRALTARNTPIEIQLRSVLGRTTRISIRVGPSGDEDFSRHLLERITRRL